MAQAFIAMLDGIDQANARGLKPTSEVEVEPVIFALGTHVHLSVRRVPENRGQSQFDELIEAGLEGVRWFGRQGVKLATDGTGRARLLQAYGGAHDVRKREFLQGRRRQARRDATDLRHTLAEGRADGVDLFTKSVGRFPQGIEPQLREGDELQRAGAQLLFDATQGLVVAFQDTLIGAADALLKQLGLDLLARQFTDLALQAAR